MREIKYQAWIPGVKQMRDVINFDFFEPDDVYTRLPQVKIWNHASTRAAKIKGHVATYFKKTLSYVNTPASRTRTAKRFMRVISHVGIGIMAPGRTVKSSMTRTTPVFAGKRYHHKSNSFTQ